MARLIYSSIVSLDGFVADSEGNFDWGVPSEEVHAFINDTMRGVGTYLYGRRMYEVGGRPWETWDTTGEPEPIVDFQRIWRAAEKVVYSRTLQTVDTKRTRLERGFAPAQVAELKASADSDLAIAGPTLAAEALRANLVDEVHLFVSPVTVGEGLHVFTGRPRLQLELLEQQAFENGTVFVRYAVT